MTADLDVMAATLTVFAVLSGLALAADVTRRWRLGDKFTFAAWALSLCMLAYNFHHFVNFVVWLLFAVATTRLVGVKVRCRRIERGAALAAQEAREAQAHRDAIAAMFEAELREWRKP